MRNTLPGASYMVNAKPSSKLFYGKSMLADFFVGWLSKQSLMHSIELELASTFNYRLTFHWKLWNTKWLFIQRHWSDE